MDGRPLTYARFVLILRHPAVAGTLQRHEESRAIRRPMRPAQPAPKDGPRINEEIRVREVQLIYQAGHEHGPTAIQIDLYWAQVATPVIGDIVSKSIQPV